jgi:hypothetical protein
LANSVRPADLGDLREYLWQPWGDLLSPYSFYNGWYETPFVLGGRTLGYDGTSGAATFLHPDAVGTTAMETGASGTVTQDTVLYPWGRWLAGNNSTSEWDAYFGSIPESSNSAAPFIASGLVCGPAQPELFSTAPAPLWLRPRAPSSDLTKS